MIKGAVEQALSAKLKLDEARCAVLRQTRTKVIAELEALTATGALVISTASGVIPTQLSSGQPGLTSTLVEVPGREIAGSPASSMQVLLLAGQRPPSSGCPSGSTALGVTWSRHCMAVELERPLAVDGLADEVCVTDVPGHLSREVQQAPPRLPVGDILREPRRRGYRGGLRGRRGAVGLLVGESTDGGAQLPQLLQHEGLQDVVFASGVRGEESHDVCFLSTPLGGIRDRFRPQSSPTPGRADLDEKSAMLAPEMAMLEP